MIHTRTFPCVLRYINPKLDNVTRKNFTWWTFFRASTQSLAIYKGTITTFSVLEIKLQKQKQTNKKEAKINSNDSKPTFKKSTSNFVKQCLQVFPYQFKPLVSLRFTFNLYEIRTLKWGDLESH